jgi:hypothetical protein
MSKKSKQAYELDVKTLKESMSNGAAINFNPVPDDSDLVMKSIFKNVADECHRQAKELAPNGINFGPYEEFKVPPAHINQRCTMTPMENNMIEVKTEISDGQVYQIGKYYLFSDGGDYWHLLKLKRLVKTLPITFEVWVTNNKFTVFNFIKEAPASECMGTITPAPVPLIHGKAYTFDYGDWKNVIGVYSQAGEFIGFTDYYNIHRSIDCTNIRAMAVVETLKGV